MKKSSSELKRMAREALLGHYGLPIGAFFLISAGSSVVSGILAAVFIPGTNISQILYFICTLIVSLLSSIFAVGLNKILLNISRGEEARLSDLMYGLKNQPDRIILVSLLVALIEFACILPGFLMMLSGTMLSILPLTALSIPVMIAGFVGAAILTLSFSQVYFLYLDAPDKSVMQLIRESRKLMNGNKGRLFYLQLSFIGLALLSVLTCFIGLIWLTPYMEMTLTQFYRNLIGEIQ